MAVAAAPSLRENPNVLNLLDFFNRPEYQSQRQEFNSILDFYDILNSHYNSLNTKMAELNDKVSEISDRKNPFTIMLEHMGNIVSSIGEKLKAIKDNIVDFSKNVFESAKDNTLSAVGAVAGTLHIGEGLQAVSESLNKAAAKVENLELFHAECMESKLLTKFEIPSDFESLSQDELKTLYTKVLDIGMNEDLSSCEHKIVQDMMETIEEKLPERGDFEPVPELEKEADQGEEM